MSRRVSPVKLTHGRHCRCSACAREDWTDPKLAPCGMHGSSCPAVYAPIHAPLGSMIRPDGTIVSEPLSAYVRRTRGRNPEGPDWLADEIQVLEDAFQWCHAREGLASPPPTREELFTDG